MERFGLSRVAICSVSYVDGITTLQMPPHLHSFPNDPVLYLVPTWEELDDMCVELAEKIIQDGKKFDRVVALAKGGWPFAKALVDLLVVPEVASIGVRFYSGINQRLQQPEIYQDLPITVKGERILLFDDVADTGESLIFTQEHLLKQGVASVTTASLYYKPQSKLIPDYYGAETTAWIVYPFDKLEGMDLLQKKWKDQHLTLDELTERFKIMGIRPSTLAFYRKQLVEHSKVTANNTHS